MRSRSYVPSGRWTKAEVQEGNRRLAMLRDYLRAKVTSRTFDMGKIGIGNQPILDEKNYCGSVGCMLGHATMVPALIEAGLEYRWSRSHTPTCWRLDVNNYEHVFRLNRVFLTQEGYFLSEGDQLFFSWPEETKNDPCASAQRLDDFIKMREQRLEDGTYPVKKEK